MALDSTCVKAETCDFPKAPESDTWDTYKTCVFWDVDEDSSELNNVNANLIYDAIKTSLDKKDYYVADLNIFAFTDERFTMTDLEYRRLVGRPISLCAFGDKYRRSLEMATCMLTFAREYKNFVVLSKNFGEDALLSRAQQLLIDLDFNVIVRPLENLIGEPLSAFAERSQVEQDGAGRG